MEKKYAVRSDAVKAFMPTPPARSMIWLNASFSTNWSASTIASCQALRAGFDFRGVGFGHVPQAIVFRVFLFDLRDCGALGGPVLRADAVGAFEGHVLEHVREARDAGDLLRRAGVDDSGVREDRSLVALEDDHGQAVVEHAQVRSLLERGEVLRGDACRDEHRDEHQQQDGHRQFSNSHRFPSLFQMADGRWQKISNLDSVPVSSAFCLLPSALWFGTTLLSWFAARHNPSMHISPNFRKSAGPSSRKCASSSASISQRDMTKQ
jgi:hypothetical protein